MPLLLLMLLIMPFEFSPYLFLSPSFLGVPDFTVIKALGMAAFGWAMLRIATGGGGEDLLGSPVVRWFLVFFLAVVLCGVTWGQGHTMVVRYLAFLAFMPIVLVNVRTLDDLRRVLQVTVLAMVLVFPYAVRQMLRYDSRLGVGLYESNYLAAWLLLLVPLAVVMARQQWTPLARRAWLAAAGILVVALLLTASRGGFLGLLVAGLLVTYRFRGVVGVGGVLLALLAGALVVPTELGTRILATVFGGAQAVPGLESSNRAHLGLFWAGLRMIADSPLFGVGPQNFAALSTRYSGLEQAYIGHNTYLELGAELGLPVLAVFVAMLAATFATLRRLRHLGDTAEQRELAGWAEGMRVGLLGFLVAAFFISAQYEKPFWLMVFLSVAAERVARGLPAADAEATAVEEGADADGLVWAREGESA
jgi:O-antigen ligase